jgi:hypothetical protein
MAKWADYLIKAVRYNNERTHIDSVQAGEDKGDTVGTFAVWDRATVASEIKRGITFMTVTKGADGNYRQGAFVRRFVLNGTAYLRTDENDKAGDNLGSLPEF